MDNSTDKIVGKVRTLVDIITLENNAGLYIIIDALKNRGFDLDVEGGRIGDFDYKTIIKVYQNN